MYVKPLSGLEWDKWVLRNFDHDRQWFNTFIPPSHEPAAVTVDCISRLSGPVRLSPRYTTADIHRRDGRYEWDGGIRPWAGKCSTQQARLSLHMYTLYDVSWCSSCMELFIGMIWLCIVRVHFVRCKKYSVHLHVLLKFTEHALWPDVGSEFCLSLIHIWRCRRRG